MKKSVGPEQLSLEVSLRDDTTFGNYFVGQNNTLAFHALQLFSKNQGDQNLLLWGGQSSGLTHLLQSCSHAAYENGFQVQYIHLNDVLAFSPDDVFEALDVMNLVCLDGLEFICGIVEWELGVFHFYNRLKDNGGRLLIASHLSPPELPLNLPDLKSRVCGSVVYHIYALTDEEKSKALRMRAKLRGMDMSEEIANFILSRAPRDNKTLFDLLSRLDKESLQLQRKLTIPFVKSVLQY